MTSGGKEMKVYNKKKMTFYYYYFLLLSVRVFLQGGNDEFDSCTCRQEETEVELYSQRMERPCLASSSRNPICAPFADVIKIRQTSCRIPFPEWKTKHMFVFLPYPVQTRPREPNAIIIIPTTTTTKGFLIAPPFSLYTFIFFFLPCYPLHFF